MPSRRLSKLVSKKKSKKKTKSENQEPEEERATKSFQVKADLQLQGATSQPRNNAEKAEDRARSRGGVGLKNKPSRATAATTTPSTSDSSSDSFSIQQQQTQQQEASTSKTKNKPYYRGGGYCSHVRRSYEERWSTEHVEMVLKSWKMTERQRDKLMRFKERVTDVDHFLLNDPQQLVYFLLDERGDVDLAEKWFRKVAHDRKESPFQHDTLCEDYELPDDYDYFPMCVLDGYDLDGDPIHITRTGAADCWGLFSRHGRENMIRHALYYQELDVRGAWMDEYEQKMNKKVTRYTVIFDLQGLSMRHIKAGLLPVLSFVSRLVQDSYPELVKRVLIIRAPSVFKMIWGLVKHFFDQDLRDLMIFATNDENSKQVMEQYIDPDVLPHVIHNEGKDGRVAKGYEHIIMEGGLLPPEGTYQTPQYAKEGRTKAEEEEYVMTRNQQQQQQQQGSFSQLGMSETIQTSNVRKHNGFVRSMTREAITCHCTNLLSGSYSPTPAAHQKKKISVQITSGR